MVGLSDVDRRERGGVAEVGKILESLRDASSGLDAAMAATRRSRSHARDVAQRLGRTGLRRMATEMGKVVELMTKCSQAMVADQKLLTDLAARTASVPDDASQDEVAASLGLVSGELEQLVGRLPATAKKLNDSQAIVAMVLKGARPGPLVGRIEEIRAPLTGVLGSVQAARSRADELIAEVRDAGRVGDGSTTGPVAASVSGAGTASAAAAAVELSSTDPAHRRQLSKPLPNATVVVDERFRYETDEQGRVVKATATLDVVDLDHPRSKSAQRTLADKLPGDDAGHLFARIFQGPGQKINLAPMEALGVNRGEYRSLEAEWREHIEAGGRIEVEVRLLYTDDTRRPNWLVVRHRATEAGQSRGTWKRVDLDNAPGEDAT